MFGRTVICIYNNQLNDNPRPKRPHYEQTETYSDEEENHYDTDTTQTESDTESENETRNQAGTQNKPKNKPEVRLEARLFKAKKIHHTTTSNRLLRHRQSQQCNKTRKSQHNCTIDV